jgi:uncharacterized membrane protein YgcG
MYRCDLIRTFRLYLERGGSCAAWKRETSAENDDMSATKLSCALVLLFLYVVQSVRVYRCRKKRVSIVRRKKGARKERKTYANRCDRSRSLPSPPTFRLRLSLVLPSPASSARPAGRVIRHRRPPFFPLNLASPPCILRQCRLPHAVEELREVRRTRVTRREELTGFEGRSWGRGTERKGFDRGGCSCSCGGISTLTG